MENIRTNYIMSKYLMSALKREAMRNFLKGIATFTFAGNCPAKILHQHNKEYGIFVHDPISNSDVEVCRIINGRIF